MRGEIWHLWGVTALMLAGCGGDVCSTACKKLQSCLKIDKASNWTCPLSSACNKQEACQAKCINDATCEAIVGNDPQYLQCTAACKQGTIQDHGVVDGPKVDGGPPAERVIFSDLPVVKQDGPVQKDLPKWPDVSVPDLYVPPDMPPGCSASMLTKTCTENGGECGSSHTCLLTDGSDGICTCVCTPDDPQTPLVNEDSCPGSNAVCGKIQLASGGYQSFCFKKCTPTIGYNACGSGASCLPESGAYAGVPDQAVCLFKGCTVNSDCPVTTGAACTTTGGGCPSGQSCLPMTSGATAGICAWPGNCDAVSGICNVHSYGKASAKVGDPCKGDVDCAGNMRCMVQFDEKTFLSGPGGSCSTSSDCCTGGTCSSGTCQGGVCVTRYRNGYCTIGGCTVSSSLTSCPYGSTCNKAYFAGMCQKTCSLSSATDCRNHSADYLGDYECRAWDQLSFSSQPVCDFGDLFTCATLSAAGIACGDLGTSGNPTNMSCRDLNNTTLTSSSATGFCLDDTASGPVLAP